LQQYETGAQVGAQCGLQKNSGALVVVAIAAMRIAENMVYLHGDATLGWQRNQPWEMVRIGGLHVKCCGRNNRSISLNFACALILAFPKKAFYIFISEELE